MRFPFQKLIGICDFTELSIEWIENICVVRKLSLVFHSSEEPF